MGKHKNKRESLRSDAPTVIPSVVIDTSQLNRVRNPDGTFKSCAESCNKEEGCGMPYEDYQKKSWERQKPSLFDNPTWLMRQLVRVVMGFVGLLIAAIFISAGAQLYAQLTPDRIAMVAKGALILVGSWSLGYGLEKLGFSPLIQKPKV